jgi:uncharacterized membrane protein
MLKASSNYLDLLCFALLTLLLAVIFFLPPWLSPLRVSVTFVFVLLAPGYALTAILFPKRDDIDAVERVVLSLGLSIASLSLVALVLNYTVWGVGVTPMTIGLSVLTLLALGAAMLRRRFILPPQRLVSSNNISAFRGSVQWLLAVVLFVAGLMTTITLLRPKETVTEFYVLGSDLRLEGYPLELRPGQTFSVTLGVTNYEGNAADFIIRIPLGTEEKTIPVPALENGKGWEQTIELSVPATNQAPITFNLYRQQDQEPYRSVQLFVTLSEVLQPLPSQMVLILC